MPNTVYPKTIIHSVFMTLLIGLLSFLIYYLLLNRFPIALIDFIAYSVSFVVLHGISKNNLSHYRFGKMPLQPTLAFVFLSFLLALTIGIPVNHLFSHNNWSSASSGPSINTLLGLILIAPFFEELLMRGIILRGLLKKYTPKVAIVTTALLFTALHLDYMKSIGLLVHGLILGYAYYKTENLLVVILMHACYNLATVYHPYSFPDHLNQVQFFSVYGTFTKGILLISSVCLIGCFIYLRAFFKKGENLRQ